jgi:hypothetical protein
MHFGSMINQFFCTAAFQRNKKNRRALQAGGTSIFLIASRVAMTAHPGAGLAAYFDAAGVDAAGAAALASSAFLSVCSFLACFTCFAFFSTAGLTSALVSVAGVAGVEAMADADATFTAGAGVLATAEAEAALAGAAGVCANALPIKTVEAIRAVMSLFMVIILNMSVSGLFVFT